jgi:hypothetical protein
MRDDIKFFLSLGAILAGWGAGFLSDILYQLVDHGYATDVSATFFFSGLFILPCWILIFLPILLWFPSGHPLFEPWRFTYVGVALGTAAYFLFVNSWAHFQGSDFTTTLLYAMVTGGVAAAVYAFAHRALLRRAQIEGTPEGA